MPGPQKAGLSESITGSGETNLVDAMWRTRDSVSEWRNRASFIWRGPAGDGSIAFSSLAPSIGYSMLAPGVDYTALAPSVGFSELAPRIDYTELAPDIDFTTG